MKSVSNQPPKVACRRTLEVLRERLTASYSTRSTLSDKDFGLGWSLCGCESDSVDQF